MIKYEVNERKGWVRAYFVTKDMEDDRTLYQRIIWAADIKNYFDKKFKGFINVVPYIEDIIVRKTSFTGWAQCHPGDKFNAEVGKKLARARLFRKYNDVRLRILRNLLVDADEMMRRIVLDGFELVESNKSLLEGETLQRKYAAEASEEMYFFPLLARAKNIKQN